MTTSPAEPRVKDRAAIERSYELRVVHSPDTSALGRSLQLDANEVLTLGRGAGGAGTFADARLSRTHARVVFDPRAGAFRIGDARSKNGTFVRQKRVESSLLNEQDVLRIGDTVLVLAARATGPTPVERAVQLAASGLAVLIVGETGTGKEVLARKLHDQGGRRGNFVAVNCAAIPRDLIAAELFGHTRGAFSGATRERLGLFRAAQGGTILLDEIGDMPLDLQAALLRVLQERTIRPVGSDQDVAVDVHVISATHADLERGMQEGRFRPDLYARLSQLLVRLPALRERRSEILSIARELARERGRELELSADAAESLVAWSFPLNVRELASLLAQFCASGPGTLLDGDQLFELRPELFEAQEEPEPAAARTPPAASMAELKRALDESGGKIAVAAERLGLSRQKLYRLMKAAGLDPADFRQDWLA